MVRLTVIFGILLFPASLLAQAPFPTVCEQVNGKLVKLFGAGGFQSLNAYGSGILVSPDGYILTVASTMLDTQDLRVHLPDGRRVRAKVVVIEAELDAALLKIVDDEKNPIGKLSYFDLRKAIAAPPAKPADWVLAFSNTFNIASRDEPVTVQRGVIAAVAKLTGRRGIFQAPFAGEVYFVDAITNNPGAAGGALTTRNGELLGLIGKEIRNTLTDTWINYTIPIHAKVEVRLNDKPTQVTMADFVELGIAGKYKPAPRPKRPEIVGGYHGIVTVLNPLDRTPPFIEDVLPESPAEKAGLRSDDLIVYVDGEPIVSVAAFREAIAKVPAGVVTKIEVRRGEKIIAVEMKLEEAKKPRK